MHRKPNRTRTIARRAAISAGATVAAVVMTAGSASAFADPVPGIGPLPLSCTGAPIDAYTACAVGGHYTPNGGNPGDATGADTPVLGGGGGK